MMAISLFRQPFLEALKEEVYLPEVKLDGEAGDRCQVNVMAMDVGGVDEGLHGMEGHLINRQEQERVCVRGRRDG
jgi:hypothetical protein